jgi:hypothetical protein
MSITLQPGEQSTATIVMQPGAATVQGLQPRIAVEGYAGNQLLGGVVLRVMVPKPLTAEPLSQHQIFLLPTLRAQ